MSSSHSRHWLPKALAWVILAILVAASLQGQAVWRAWQVKEGLRAELGRAEAETQRIRAENAALQARLADAPESRTDSIDAVLPRQLLAIADLARRMSLVVRQQAFAGKGGVSTTPSALAVADPATGLASVSVSLDLTIPNRLALLRWFDALPGAVRIDGWRLEADNAHVDLTLFAEASR